MTNVSFAFLLTALAGLSTGIGSAIAYFIRRPRYAYLAVAMGFASGVMVYISFVELLKMSISSMGFSQANLWFFAGIGFIALIDILVPHQYEGEQPHKKRRYGPLSIPGTEEPALSADEGQALKRTGMLTALGIAIHNFPEGMVTFSSTISGQVSLGIGVAIAIAVHNIPEGIAVSLPIFYATGSRRRAFLYSFSAGLAEPLGAVIGYAILRPFITPTLLAGLLAFVAGVMVYISLDELLPLAHQYGKPHSVIAGIMGGMAIMALSSYLLQ